MSSSSLIDWFERFLFGHTCILKPPCELYKLVARLESEGIHWKDMVRQGGLTLFRYQVQGDLDLLLEALDQQKDMPPFKTRCVTQFCALLLAILQKDPEPSPDDQVALERILQDGNASVTFHSAKFWGELCRQWLNHRRPLPKELAPCPDYRGRKYDPLSLVPASVNPVHWQSGEQLEAFVRLRPHHALSKAVQSLVIRSLDQFLAGQYPSCVVQQDSKVATFLQNVAVADEVVPKVTVVAASPPRVIDVFHRLLALAQLDDLWTTVPKEAESMPATQTMQLTEQLLLAERQNRLLLQHHVSCD